MITHFFSFVNTRLRYSNKKTKEDTKASSFGACLIYSYSGYFLQISPTPALILSALASKSEAVR